MSAVVYRQYDQDSLDKQYDNARKVPAQILASHRATWAKDSRRGDEYLRHADAWRSDLPQFATAVLPGGDHFSMRAGLNDPTNPVCRLIWAQMGIAGAPPPR